MSQRAIASTGLMGGVVNAARLVGGLLLGFLFLVVPSYNPAVLNTGSERLYVGGVLVLAAATTAVVPLFAARAWWVLAASSFAALYVLEGAVRTHDSFNVIANAYRPLQPIVAYCACALLLTPERRGRWLMLLLAGGAIGSTLAALHTFVPGFDPFSVSRPSQPFVSEYGSGLQRETGAFAYPNNLGTYCAYIAVIGLTVMSTKRDRKVIILLGLVVTSALTGLFVSGARAALLGFLAGAVVLTWRQKHIRLPLVGGLVGAGLLFAGFLTLTGHWHQVVADRIGGVGTSLSIRFPAWQSAWHVLLRSPLYGAGPFTGTIDASLAYLIQVGGLIAVALVIGMYWFSALRPVRFGDRSSVPLLVAVAASSLLQDSLGQPLVNWLIGAGVWLISSPLRAPAPSAEEAAAETRRARAPGRLLAVGPPWTRHRRSRA